MSTFSTRDKEEFFLGDLDVYIDDDVNPSAYTRAETPVVTPCFGWASIETVRGVPRTEVFTAAWS